LIIFDTNLPQQTTTGVNPHPPPQNFYYLFIHIVFYNLFCCKSNQSCKWKVMDQLCHAGSTRFHSHNASLCQSHSPSINPITIGMTHLITLIFVCVRVCVCFSVCVCLFQSPPPVLYWSLMSILHHASLLPPLCLRALSHSLLSI